MTHCEIKTTRVVVKDSYRPVAARLGWFGFIFGLPFLGMGIFANFYTLMDPTVVGNDFPLWIVILVVNFFTVTGLYLVLSSAHGLWVGWRFKSRMKHDKREHWLKDYNWDQTGTVVTPWPHVTKFLGLIIVAAAVMTPIIYILFFVAIDSLFPLIILCVIEGIFALILIVLFISYGKKMCRAIALGSSACDFKRFPFWIGGPFEVNLRLPHRLRQAEAIKISLRQLEYQWDKRETGDGTEHKQNIYQCWKQSIFLEDISKELGPSCQLRLQYNLPGDLSGSALHAANPIFWELWVQVTFKKKDEWSINFLVPVYEKNRPGA